jgi:hypothetical protein
MRNLLSPRLLTIAAILVICAVLIGHNMGVAGAQAPTNISVPGSTLAADPAPHTDWALTGLLLGGALIILLRPRRRKVVQATNE